MRAATRERYGSPDVVELEEVEKPELADDGVLVRVHASSLNRADWYSLTGTPYVARPSMGFLKPRSPLLGVDFAGTVEAVGKDVEGFQPGQEVFGGRSGALAEYLCVKNGIAPKPSWLTLEEAAALPVAALTALQGLRDKGNLQPGQRVLINGASGGVGTFAVQIAKALGGEVTAVCSTRNVEQARSLGADHVIDYMREDFTRGDERYDLMFDVAGGRSWSDCKRVLKPEATLVIAGAPKGNALMGPLSHIIKLRLGALRGSRKVVFFIAKITKRDLAFLTQLVEAGKVRPVVERRHELSEVVDALRYLGEGHAQGKIVITVTR
jgi:NADPH:quinone reductase-like Zn-dependent oxidoreductase